MELILRPVVDRVLSQCRLRWMKVVKAPNTVMPLLSPDSNLLISAVRWLSMQHQLLGAGYEILITKPEVHDVSVLEFCADDESLYELAIEVGWHGAKASESAIASMLQEYVGLGRNLSDIEQNNHCLVARAYAAAVAGYVLSQV